MTLNPNTASVVCAIKAKCIPGKQRQLQNNPFFLPPPPEIRSHTRSAPAADCPGSARSSLSPASARKSAGTSAPCRQRAWKNWPRVIKYPTASLYETDVNKQTKGDKNHFLVSCSFNATSVITIASESTSVIDFQHKLTKFGL